MFTHRRLAIMLVAAAGLAAACSHSDEHAPIAAGGSAPGVAVAGAGGAAASSNLPTQEEMGFTNYPTLSDVSVTRGNDPNAGGKGVWITAKSPDSIVKVAAFYRDQLKKLVGGHDFLESGSNASMVLGVAIDNRFDVSIALAPDGSGTNIVITAPILVSK